MRPYEIVLSICLVFGAFSLASHRFLRPVFWLVAAACVLAAHLILEGAHWQLIPAYLAFLLFAAVVLLRVQGGRIFIVPAMLLLCVAAWCVSTALPMFRFPAPTGRYPVGTRMMYLAGGGKGLGEAAG